MYLCITFYDFSWNYEVKKSRGVYIFWRGRVQGGRVERLVFFGGWNGKGRGSGATMQYLMYSSKGETERGRR